MEKKLSEEAFSQRVREADAYSQLARMAFIDGYEAAVEEAEEFTQLRAWLEEQRDEAIEAGDDAAHREDTLMKMAKFGERMGYIQTLAKLSQIGVHETEPRDIPDISEEIKGETISSSESDENDEHE